MNKKFIQVPLILAAICVGSAALISGVHYLTSSYKASHVNLEAPKEIKALYSNDKDVDFEIVSDFKEVSKVGNSTKVTLTSCYYVIRNGEKNGLAYLVDAGKPVKTEVLFALSFEGEAVSSMRPSAINVYQGGDSGYDINVKKYADGMVSGSVSLDSSKDIISGGTKSQKCLFDGVTIARDDYLTRYNTVTAKKEGLVNYGK